MLADMYSYVDLSVMQHQHQSSWISTVLLAEVVNYTRIYYMTCIHSLTCHKVEIIFEAEVQLQLRPTLQFFL